MNAPDDRTRALLDQFPLFPFRAEVDKPATEAKPGRYSSRPRSYDEPILKYVGYYRLVTTHQVVCRFFTFDGKGARYGFQVVRDLVRGGFLQSEPLDREEGAASRQVVSVTPVGWAALRHRTPPDSRRAVAGSVREYRLQFAETMLEREADGWRFVRDAAAFPVLREWGLRQYRDRLLNDTEAVLRERLERLAPFRSPVHLLTHRSTGDVRLILPVRKGLSFTRILESLPHLGLFPTLHFELVCSHLELFERARDSVRRWAERSRSKVQVHHVDHFRTRSHPNKAARPTHSRYARSGSPDPRDLL